MRAHAIFPGALLAGALTAGALFVLVLALGLRGDGPLSLGLGDADGSARLSDGAGAAARVGGREASPLASPLTLTGGGGFVAPATVLAPRALAGAPGRAITRSRTVATRPALRSPARRRAPAIAPAPAAPAPVANTTAPAPAATPVAVSTPNPVAVKVRGRGKKAAPPPKVPKARVKPEKPAPPPPPATPDRVPAPGPGPPDDTGPPADKHRVEPPGQAQKGVGTDDGTLKRVPGGPRP